MVLRGNGRRWARAASVVLVAVLAVATAAVTPARADGPVRYEPPVEAKVVEPFHVDGGPYSKGNRGLDYGTRPGTEVRAAADGSVTFAGTVAGSKHVTVLHADGVRTSYSFLDEIRVARGQRVRRGQVLGTTAGELHFGARRGDAYFDPASLFDGPPKVRLVKFDRPPGTGLAGERSALRQLAGGFAGAGRFLAKGGSAALAAGKDGLGWAATGGEQLASTMVHYVATAPSLPRALFVVGRIGYRAWGTSHRRCTKGSTAAPPLTRRHTAVLVGGLGSTSTNAAIDEVDTGTLGYRDEDVVRYSYAGGRTPDERRGASFAGLPTNPYRSEDTQGDLFAEGEQLADFLEAVVAEQLGRPVDVFAHSQGGIVTRLALLELVARHGRSWMGNVGHVATIATPHGGADIATAAYAVNRTFLGGALLEVGGLVTSLDADATAVRQLSETSEVIRRLHEHGIPEGVRAISIAARTDPVVPVPRTKADGATSSVISTSDPRAHDQLPGDPRTTRELGLSLAGRPPSCKGFGTAFADEGTGELISGVVDALGPVATVIGGVFGG